MNSDSNTLRIGSLNLLNNPDGLEDRIPTLISEAIDKNFQVLCLQEVLEVERPRIEQALFAAGFTACSYAPTILNHRTGHRDGTAIFTKVAPTSFDTFLFNVDGERSLEKPTIPAMTAHLEVNGRNVHVITCHFAWGSRNESVRLRQASEVSDYAARIMAADSDAVVLLAGDLNASEDFSTIRFFHGKQENMSGESTFWVDSWVLHGSQENWVTSDPDSFWGHRTAAGVGLTHANMIPKRRIDYIMSYGWCYGRHGSPLSFSRFGDVVSNSSSDLSDHFGIYSDIYVPALGVSAK